MPDSPAVALPATYTEQPVLWQHRWNPALLSFRVARDPAYLFVPGQFASIGLAEPGGEDLWRAYSIVSAPHEHFLEFFMVVLPDGRFSRRVAALAPGETMRVEAHAQGFLTLDRFRHGNDLWLIATGTGLAPYISMLRDPHVWQAFENIVVVLSVREHRDFAYLDELKALAAQSPQAGQARFRLVTTLTRDKGGEGLHGRVTALAESGALEQAAGIAFDDERSRFMLCGNPDMVEAMRASLKGRGFRMNRRLTPGHIIVENYW
ncbi:MAG: ferredoxin--NADP reductase [Betaproteobacteria bacterium]|nr:ferredoxin--NADP reductase [Betaproteobacteria bacterium]